MIYVEEVQIPVDHLALPGNLSVPEGAKGIVIFAHGSGSSRLSERNRFVADRLVADGFATLLFDLLTEYEDADFERRFDIDLLTDRLGEAVDWASQQPRLKGLPIGLFGASTGAAAALRVAAEMGPDLVTAVVSRGGRTDLAGHALHMVKCPTLFIVGGLDLEVLRLNKDSLALLPKSTPAELQVVLHAGHLFGEPGALEKVSDFASQWFAHHLVLWQAASMM